jgi:hypothetical protein
VVQAEIAACHAQAASVKDTDWERIAALYVVLAHLTPSPVVELNRAVAVGMAYGPARGLAIADTLTGQPVLAGYAQLPAVRGDLLAKLGRLAEARAEFTRAAELTGNERERAIFVARAATLAGRGDGEIAWADDDDAAQLRERGMGRAGRGGSAGTGRGDRRGGRPGVIGRCRLRRGARLRPGRRRPGAARADLPPAGRAAQIARADAP